MWGVVDIFGWGWLGVWYFDWSWYNWGLLLVGVWCWIDGLWFWFRGVLFWFENFVGCGVVFVGKWLLLWCDCDVSLCSVEYGWF